MGEKSALNNNLIGWIPSSTNLNVASSRIRCMDPMHFLQSQHYPIELFDPHHANRYSAVVFSKKYSLHDYQLAKKLQANGTKIILDLCDNHFYNPEENETLAKRTTNLRNMLNLCDILSVSTLTLKEIILEQCQFTKKIFVIDDAPETQLPYTNSFWKRCYHIFLFLLYQKSLNKYISAGHTPIVWFGTHGQPHIPSGMEDLKLIQSDLEKTHRTSPIILTVISNSKQKHDALFSKVSFPTLYIQWHPETFLSILHLQTIAVIPAQKNPFTLCKSNNRLVLAISNNLAVLASEIPSYKDFKDTCFLDRFEEGLHTYIHDNELRQQHIAHGKKQIIERWSLETIAYQWKNLFDYALKG